MATKLSVFIITKDEEKNIRRCLDSVGWADEIVVLDSGSQDATESICRQFTGHFYTQDFKDYASQKNKALSLTSGEWALSLDADEEVTPELKVEILSMIQAGKHSAYRIHRRSRIFGRWMRATGTQEDVPVRLMKRSARFEQPIHETVTVEGPVGRLKNPILHYTYDNLSDYVARMNRYTSREAELMASRGRKPKVLGTILRSMAMFLRLYALKGGWRDGQQGFLFSVLSAFYVFLKNVKCLEIVHR